MKMKNDANIEEELTCRFKIDMRSFTNFDLKKFVFQLAPCDQTIYYLSCKSTEELSFMTLKRYTNFEEKLTCGSQKDLRNLANFNHSTWKCQNLDFDGILLSKVEKVWHFNFQMGYVSWQWRIMQNLKRNWLVISKLTWGISRILTPLENLKKLLFNWLLWPKIC